MNCRQLLSKPYLLTRAVIVWLIAGLFMLVSLDPQAAGQYKQMQPTYGSSDWDMDIYGLYGSSWFNPVIVDVFSTHGPVGHDTVCTITIRSRDSDRYILRNEGFVTTQAKIVIRKGNDHATAIIELPDYLQFRAEVLIESDRIEKQFSIVNYSATDQLLPIITYQAPVICTDTFVLTSPSDYTLSENLKNALAAIKRTNFQLSGGGAPTFSRTDGCIHPHDLSKQLSATLSDAAMITTAPDLQRLSQEFPQKVQALRIAIEQGLHLIILCDSIGNDQQTAIEQALHGTWNIPNLKWSTRSDAVITSHSGNGSVMMVQSQAGLSTSDITALINSNRDRSRILTETHINQQAQIPGIGKRPAGLFLIMVITFVLVSGPFLFVSLCLRKQRNLYWIGLPFCSFLASASVFGYVLSTDGVGLQGASIGTYVINQRSGFTTRLLNHTLYATSIADGEISWDESTAVRVDSYNGQTPPLTKSYTNDGTVRLSGEGVISRSHMEFLETGIELRNSGIVIGKRSKNLLTARNQLNSNAGFIYIRDRDGNHWLAEDCQADVEIELQKIDFPSFAMLFRRQLDSSTWSKDDFPNSFDIYEEFRFRTTMFTESNHGPLYIAIVDSPPQRHGPIDSVNWRLEKYLVLGLLE